MKDILKDRRIVIGLGVVIIILIATFVISRLIQRENLIDIGDIMNEQASEKTEEQLQYHYIITRNSTWGEDYDSIYSKETGNIIDAEKGKYITVDYETLFDVKFLPTYLFDGGDLCAILYEADLGAEDISQISLIHNDFAVSIHYVYENLYRENNKWSSGQARKYDTNLWSNAILDGKLTLQSIWNSNDEKVFLLTGQSSYFKFIEHDKERTLNPAMSFIVIEDDYLEKNNFNDLVKIIPSN